MLKIKNEIDLKELEKYGFREQEGIYEVTSDGINHIDDDYLKNIDWMFTADINKELLVVLNPTSHNQKIKIQEVLYDLIKDGLVEKVD